MAGGERMPQAANAEIKCVDASANPYLLVGGVIAAGLAGLADGDGARLPDPVSGDPARTGTHMRLPGSAQEVLRRFEESRVLRAALGEELFGAVRAVRAGEIALFEGASDHEIAAATRGRY